MESFRRFLSKALLAAAVSLVAVSCVSVPVMRIDQTVVDDAGGLEVDIEGVRFNARQLSYEGRTLQPNNLDTHELSLIELEVRVADSAIDADTGGGPVDIRYHFGNNVALIDDEGAEYPASAATWDPPNRLLRGGIKELSSGERGEIQFRASVRAWDVTLGVLSPQGANLVLLRVGPEVLPLPERPAAE